MCSLGLRCPKSKVPVLKPTLIVTTMQELFERLQSCRCDGKHVHAHLEGKFKGRNLSSWCEVYPNKFCQVLSETLSKSSHSLSLSLNSCLMMQKRWNLCMVGSKTQRAQSQTCS